MTQNRQLAAIMFTDIVGYTTLMEKDEEKALQTLEKNRNLHKPILDKYNGRWIKEGGDSVLAIFGNAYYAVYAAIEIQEECYKLNEYQLHIGIDIGDVEFQNGDVFGRCVNNASRLLGVAKAGMICISEQVRQNIINKKGISIEFIGEITLKNIEEPMRVYEVITSASVRVPEVIINTRKESKIYYSSNEEKIFNFTENTFKFKKEINELANEFAFDHLANSFGDMPNQPIKCKYIFSREEIDEKLTMFDLNYFGKGNKTICELFQYRKDKNTEKSCRNILIIGDDASNESYNYISLKKDLQNTIEESFKNEFKNAKIINQKFQQDKEDIIKKNDGILSFENFLSLMSNFIPDNLLLSKLKEITRYKYEPNLFYEITAHLFKHNFIDVIINFNYDNLLDNAIEEEVGKNNYHFVHHNGTCPTMEDLIEDSRLKVPVYIKPYGGVDYKSSISLAKKEYFEIPLEIKNLIKSLIGGERESNNKKIIKRINLVCVGFDFKNLEFNEILNEKPLPSESRIYDIAKGNSTAGYRDTVLKNLTCIANEGKNRFITIDLNGFKPDRIITPYAEFFSILWRSIYGRFQEMYRPRSIGRHEILSFLFYRKEPASYSQDLYFRFAIDENERNHRIRDYFIDRIMVEIALVLNRSNGIIDIIHLLNGRIGEYYNLYRSQADLFVDESKLSIYELLGEFTRKAEFSSVTKQSEFIYSKNVFRVMPIEESKFNILLERIQENKHFITENLEFYNMFISELKSVYKKNPIAATILYKLFLSDKLSETFKNKFTKDFNLLINNGLFWNDTPKPLLREIFRLFSKSAPKNYFYIRSSRNDQKNFMWESFKKRNLLLTTLSYKYHFRNHFLNPGIWDVLLCISETGSLVDFLDVLTKNTKDYEEILNQLKSGKKRLVIVCSYENVRQQHCASEEQIDVTKLINLHKSSLAGGMHKLWDEVTIDLLLLPYWQHNHHSIIFLKKVNKQTVGDQNDKHYYFNVNGKDSNELNYDIGFILNRSYYYYKKGFSNSINPLFFSPATNQEEWNRLRNDQLKLLSLFFTYICRSIVFLSGANSSDPANSNEAANSNKSWFNKLSPCFNNIATLQEYQQYTQWDHAYFDNKLRSFMSYIYHRSYGEE